MDTGAAGAPSEGSACSGSSQMTFLTSQFDADLQPSFRAAESRVAEIIQQSVQDVEARISASLQQATIDIAAHLGKEAAGRLIAAERKVMFLEHELVNTKEQALSMLLRLKHATDTQIFDLEKRLEMEKRRADDAEAKVVSLDDSLKRLKRKEEVKTSKTSQSGGEQPPPSGRSEVEDPLALIAGIVCEMRENSESPLTEASNKGKKVREDDGNEHNASVTDGNSGREKSGLASITEEEQDEEESDEKSDSGGEEEEEEEDELPQAGIASLAAAAAVETTRHSLRLQQKQQKLLKQQHKQEQKQRGVKRKSKRISASEKLTRLMAGSKRARGKASRNSGGDTKESKKPSTGGGGVESSRDSRRLMQGARQLFSLAERKW